MDQYFLWIQQWLNRAPASSPALSWRTTSDKHVLNLGSYIWRAGTSRKEKGASVVCAYIHLIPSTLELSTCKLELFIKLTPSQMPCGNPATSFASQSQAASWVWVHFRMLKSLCFVDLNHSLASHEFLLWSSSIPHSVLRFESSHCTSHVTVNLTHNRNSVIKLFIISQFLNDPLLSLLYLQLNRTFDQEFVVIHTAPSIVQFVQGARMEVGWRLHQRTFYISPFKVQMILACEDLLKFWPSMCRNKLSTFQTQTQYPSMH